MTPGGSVQLTYLLEEACEELVAQGVQDGMTLAVEAVVSDYHPAVRYTRNGDPGWPAEGGEVEDLTVTSPDGRVLDLPLELEQHLVELVSEKHGRDGW